MSSRVRAQSAPAALLRTPPKTPKVPRATRGPFGTTFEGLDPDSRMYKIMVYGSDGEHRIFRRYTHFVDLREQLIASGLPGAAELPQLPPKSFFRKNFSEKFMFQRASCLRSLFQAVLDIDRFVSSDALVEFLAIKKAHRGSKPSKVMSWVVEDWAAETEVEEMDSSSDSVRLADAEDAVGLVQKASLCKKASPAAPVKKPSRRVPGRMQRARARMCLLVSAEEPRP